MGVGVRVGGPPVGARFAGGSDPTEIAMDVATADGAPSSGSGTRSSEMADDYASYVEARYQGEVFGEAVFDAMAEARSDPEETFIGQLPVAL